MRTVNSGLASGLLALALAVGAGCPSRHDAEPELAISVEVVKYLPVLERAKFDILFVVDNSASAAAAQAKLVAAFPEFTGLVLATWGGPLPSVQIGVITADLGTLGTDVDFGDGACQGMGDGGVMRRCDQVDGPFIQSIDIQGDGINETVNFTGPIEEAFACMADVGTDGCGIGQPLEAMRRALDPSLNLNPGFLRDEAVLMVVFVTDSDDCSVRDPGLFAPSNSALGPLDAFRCFEFGVTCDEDAVDERAPGPRSNCTSNETSPFLHSMQGYVSFLRSLKSDPTRVLVAVIAGDAEPVDIEMIVDDETGEPHPVLAPSCSWDAAPSSFTATPPIRLQTLANLMPDRSASASVCRDTVIDAFLHAGAPLWNFSPNPCFENGMLDVDPQLPGMQPHCLVSDVADWNGTPIETPLAACDVAWPDEPSNLPCWRTVPMPELCTLYEAQLGLEVIRAVEPPAETTIVARCEGEVL